jgi:hypothetical protein
MRRFAFCQNRRLIKLAAVLVVAAPAVFLSTVSRAEDSPGYYTDPATGIVYRKVIRTIERPIVETKVTQQQQTVYKPKTVVETKPTTRRTYLPVTEYRWVPKVEGRWNPFRQPAVAYHHVPETRWQANDQVVAETTTQVQWEPVTQTVEVPQQLTRISREQQVDYEPIGRVAPAASSVASNVAPEIAARLRPLASQASIQPIGAGTSQMAAGTYASRERHRSTLQTGLRATELSPGSTPAYSQPLGIGDTSGIAGLGVPRMWR